LEREFGSDPPIAILADEEIGKGLALIILTLDNVRVLKGKIGSITKN
jgi:hypothetical protein